MLLSSCFVLRFLIASPTFVGCSLYIRKLVTKCLTDPTEWQFPTSFPPFPLMVPVFHIVFPPFLSVFPMFPLFFLPISNIRSYGLKHAKDFILTFSISGGFFSEKGFLNFYSMLLFSFPLGECVDEVIDNGTNY